MKKILVIDGNSIINRAFYGVRPLSTKSGKPTNAIFGMINIISRQLNAVKPDYAAVAFDLKIPTFRHKMYDGYKQGRHPTPEDLLMQFDDAKECLSLMGLKILELPGYEADDIQGTIAAMAHTAKEECEAYVLSGDRDLLQLIDEKITVLLASNSDTSPIKEPEFYEKYGISPKSFVDMKALMGDSSDNIPGVAGVGEKTAGNLIRLFGSLDGIYENIDSTDISKGVREKLIRDKDNAYLSKTLAKIETNAPVGVSLEDIVYTGIDKCGLYKKFTELELSSLITKFGLTGEEVKKECCECESSEFKEFSKEEIINKIGKRFALSLKDNSLYLYNKIETNMVFSGDFSELSAIFENADSEHSLMCILADKEETGSEGNTGMQADLFTDLIADISLGLGANERKVRANSKCLSADVSAAYDPNFPEVFEKSNTPLLSCGAVLTKYTGARGKSSTNDASAEYIAWLRVTMDKDNVLWQTGELGKVDVGGGGTVAKYVAKHNVDTIDLGVPVISMHAPYEVVSKVDVYETYRAFCAFSKN